MPYSQEAHSELLSAEEQKLSKDIAICRDVKDMLESPGWKNTAGLLLDRMIMDVLGGKIGNEWVSGKLDRARSEEKREFYIGYKQALIDLHGRLMFHNTQLPIFESRLKALEAEKKERYRIPLTEDTRYNMEEPNEPIA